MSKKELEEDVGEEELFLESNIPKEFLDLDHSFRCQICGDLFDKAVTITCGHTFCSVCIRNYWVATRTGKHRQKTACPSCRTPINVMDVEKALVMNRSIQEGVKAFKQILVQRDKSSKNPDEDSSSTQSQEKRRRSKRKSSATIDDVHHGDGSFASENESNSADEELPIQQKMQSRNYSRMKKRELQKLCRDLKISATGNEQELRDRLRNFQNMWNAEVLHSIDPKRPSEIAAKLNSEEKAQQEERKLARANGASNVQNCMKNLNASIASGNNKVTSGNASFDKELKASFKAMTDKLKARMKNIGKRDARSKNEIVGEPVYAGKERSTCTSEERVSRQGSATPTVEVIDIDSCSDVLLGSSLTTDTNGKFTQRPPTSSSGAFPEPNLRCSEQSSSSSFPALRHETKSNFAGPSLITSRRSDRTKKRRSTSSLVNSRMAWSCSRCTYENKGIDFVCQMCGHRKS